MIDCPPSCGSCSTVWILGVGNTYHMREVGKQDHREIWIAGLEAKFEGKGKPFDREKFDSLFGDYSVKVFFPEHCCMRPACLRAVRLMSGYSQGVSDILAVIFYVELILAYPCAKIFLTTRDEDKWCVLIESTVWKATPIFS